MQSKIALVAARAVESSWLAALLVVPVFFDPHTARGFDADKTLVFRSIAVGMLGGLIVWVIEEGRRAYTPAGRPIWQAPIVASMLLLTVAYALSTLFGIAPRLSLWGTYFRCQGLYTWLCDVVVFCAVVLVVRRRAQIDRLATAALLASLPPAVYALIQHLGRDPIEWQISGAAHDRIGSTLGNPIFAGAFMIMVVPVTLARLIEQVFGRSGERQQGPPYQRSGLLAATYLLVLTLQLLTVVYSQSRGPFVGLAAGLTVFFMAYAAQHRIRRMTLLVTVIATFAFLVLSVSILPGSRLGRLGGIRSQVQEGTGKVRVLIWQGVAELLAAKPLRILTGYGPDTMALAYEPFYPPQLARYEGRIVTPDRAHNETFDALVTTGVIGCAAQLILFGSLFYSMLLSLGMVKTPAQRNALAGMMGLGATIGAVTPYLIDGSMRFSGVGLPAGMIVGLISYVSAAVVSRRRGEQRSERSGDLILAGLLAAAVAHFVEIQVGIATVSTRLYFAVFAGVAVAIGVWPADEQGGGEEAALTRHPPQSLRAWPNRSVVLHGAMVGLILIALTYEFSLPALRPSDPRFVLLWLFLGTWLGGLLLLGADSSVADGTPHRLMVNVSTYALISSGLWLLFAVIHVWWISWQPLPGEPAAMMVRDIATHVANSISILYLFIFGIIVLTALLTVRRTGSAVARVTPRPPWRYGLYAVLLTGGVAVIIATNLNGARADSFNRLGSTFERDRRWREAHAAYEDAQRLQPAEETFAINLGRVLMEQARATPSDAPEERAAYLAQALAAVQRAQRANPPNPLHTRNLARLHRVWASLAVDAEQQARHFDQAESYYAQATRDGPHNAALWKEWATLYLEWHQPQKALAKLDESLRLDDDADTSALRAQTSLAIETAGAPPDSGQAARPGGGGQRPERAQQQPH